MTLEEFLKLSDQSQAKFGHQIGVSQGAVSQWLRGVVPAGRVRQIVAATAGKVTAYEIRPDLYPHGFEFPVEMIEMSQPSPQKPEPDKAESGASCGASYFA